MEADLVLLVKGKCGSREVSIGARKERVVDWIEDGISFGFEEAILLDRLIK
jgi:hypothetical protein